MQKSFAGRIHNRSNTPSATIYIVQTCVLCTKLLCLIVRENQRNQRNNQEWTIQRIIGAQSQKPRQQNQHTTRYTQNECN